MPLTGEDWPRDGLPKGTHLYGYRIDGVLGRGGFGITYRALDRIDQVFAVKECFPRQFALRHGVEVLPTDTVAAESLADCLGRFVREAKALLHLSRLGAAGDGVVRVMMLFETNGTAYIVMEFVEGESLDSLIKANPGGIAANRLTPIVTRLLHAVGCAHEAGLLHRDIKPSNVLLRPGDRPVLIDFGAVRGVTSGHTRTFTQIYSESYAPIEQMTGGPQGPYSDIYAIGATCYRAIGGTTVDALTRHLAVVAGKPDPLVSATTLGAGRYPPPLLDAIDAALRIPAEDRPQSVEAFRALLAVPAGADTIARTEASPSPVEPAAGENGGRPDKPSRAADSEIEGRIGRSRQGNSRRTPGAAAEPSLGAAPNPASARYDGERNSRGPDRSKPQTADPVRRVAWLVIFLGVVVVGWYAFSQQHFMPLPSPKPAPTKPLSPVAAPATALPAAPKAASSRLPKPAPAPLPSPPPKAASSATAPASPSPDPEVSAAEAFRRGLAAEQRKDYAAAVRWYRKAADQGNAVAQNNLGVKYERGWGVSRDYGAAVRWYRKAADQGNARAEDNLGLCYVNGRGVPRNYAKAMRWWRKAADQGDAKAQHNIGLMYARGDGVAPDLREARRWMQKAVASGDAGAKKWLAAH